LGIWKKTDGETKTNREDIHPAARTAEKKKKGGRVKMGLVGKIWLRQNFVPQTGMKRVQMKGSALPGPKEKKKSKKGP